MEDSPLGINDETGKCALNGIDEEKITRERDEDSTLSNYRTAYETSRELVAMSPSCNTHKQVILVGTDSASPIMELSWNADWAWVSRMHYLLLECLRLKVMLAWSSTLGGAYSALGDTFISHAEKAGMISKCQLVLAWRMSDDLLAARCKLYSAYSLLQRQRLHRAAKIVREQYHFVSKECIVRDPQLEAMCLSIWKRLQYFHQLKHSKRQLPLPPPPSSSSHTDITGCTSTPPSTSIALQEQVHSSSSLDSNHHRSNSKKEKLMS